MKYNHSITLLIGSLILASCYPKAEKPKEIVKQTAQSFKEDTIGEMIPALNGGAYAESYSSGIWFFYNAEVTRVKYFTGQPSSDKTQFEEATSFDISPSTSGGAYATSSNDKIWYLYEAVAYPVKEVSSISVPVKSTAIDPSFILYQAEIRKRKTAENRLEETSSNNSESFSDPIELNYR